MLDMARTRIEMTREYDLLSSVSVDTEGVALQLAIENGIGKARPSNATADTIFLGFLWGERFAPPATVPFAEVLTLGSDSKATLSKTPTAEADCLVILGSGYGGTTLANNATLGASQWDMDSDGKTVMANAAHAGKQIFVVYRYALTVLEAQTRYGDAFPGPRAMNTVKRVGAITRGFVYTDRFDTAVDWSTIDTVASGEVIKGGANGFLTVTGNGCALTGFAHVISAPSANDPWLGLYINR